MKPTQPLPVKYFVGALYTEPSILQAALNELEKIFGIIDLISPEFNFEVTNYYTPEMGNDIKRRFYGFTRLLPSEYLSSAKITTNTIEEKLAIEGKRKVNLDIGYIDFDKVVLASAKYCIHKIHLACGIYADLTLHYAKGRFQPYPWAFADFKSGQYEKFFLELRSIYKKQLKALRNQSPNSL